MGWKSTIDLTRKQVLEELRPYLDDLEERTDEQLCDLLEVMKGGEDHGHNYRIVEGKE